MTKQSVDYQRLHSLQELKKDIQVDSRGLDNFIKANGRSADFTSSIAYGCLEACSYCYVQRHNINGNPLRLYSNFDLLIEKYKLHHDKLTVPKPINFKSCDSKYPSGESDSVNYTYDVGESSDLLHRKVVSYTNRLITALVPYKLIKPTFATKICNPVGVRELVDCPIATKARIRASVAPQHVINNTELFTAPVEQRLKGLNIAVEKGYEGHINFSPIILTSTWVQDYADLMQMIDKTLTSRVKEQLKCEVIFLTHDVTLHNWNKEHFPLNSEEYLWRPRLQEAKTNQRNSTVLRYNWKLKSKACSQFAGLAVKYLPYMSIRYMF